MHNANVFFKIRLNAPALSHILTLSLSDIHGPQRINVTYSADPLNFFQRPHVVEIHGF